LRLVSPALKHIVLPVLSRTGYLRYAAGSGPAILTYHGVFPAGYEITNPALDGNLVRADSFRQQLRLLKKHYYVVSPEDFLRWSEGELSLPHRSILLTCDDALRNTLTEMVPILREFDLSCLFMATGASADETPSLLWYEELYLMLLEASEPISLNLPEAEVRLGPIAPDEKHSCWWNLVRRLSQFDGERRRGFLDQIRDLLGLLVDWKERFIEDSILSSRFLMLDRAGLRQLAAAGMTVGAHTLSHPILAQASAELVWREISESRSVLEKALEQTVWAFGYPFGTPDTVTRRDVRLAARAGFRCAFMNVGWGLEGRIDHFALPRVHITADMSLFEFEAHISGFYHSLRKKLMGGDEPEVLVGA
jgi:peptidoglycan/xylan/chitin deacetylase (PgdA/CDA1 family)